MHMRAIDPGLTDLPAVACIAVGSHFKVCNALLALDAYA